MHNIYIYIDTCTKEDNSWSTSNINKLIVIIIYFLEVQYLFSDLLSFLLRYGYLITL